MPGVPHGLAAFSRPGKDIPTSVSVVPFCAACGNARAMSIRCFVRSYSSQLMPLAMALGTACARELQIPAFTAYTLPDTDSPRISERGGVRGWTDPANSVHWYGRLNQPGALQAKLRLRLPEGAESKLRLTVAGGFREVTVKGVSGSEPFTADFGTFSVERPGYQDFRLESLNPKGLDAGQLEALILDGPALEGAHFNLKERRNAASVHLSYKAPTNAIAAFYCEVTAVEEPVTTFYMACGWHRGYFGMQVNSPTERRIIFSVWDSGNEAVDRNKVSAEQRVQLLGKGDGVYSGDFGNEGTGGHSHLKYPWKTGQTQRFLVTAQPTNQTFTVYSGYYHHPDSHRWMLISSWKAPREGGWLRSPHSFSENFWGSTGHLPRKALYGRQWIRTPSGEWLEITEASFSHDPTGKSDRLDRFMGVEKGEFFLSHGGFLEGTMPFGQRFTRPATSQPPKELMEFFK